jgi:hypothetical protein
MRCYLQLSTGACVAAALLVFAPAAGAQTQQSQSPQLQSPAPGASDHASITDQKLDQVAAAVKNVADLKTKYRQRLANAAPAEQSQIANEAQNAITKAVTDQGLSVEDYQSVLEVAQADPDLRAKIIERIDRSSSAEEDTPNSSSGSSTDPANKPDTQDDSQ